MKIDVAIATFNSSHTIFECLKSIQKNIPYRKIFIVDGGSTDDTLEKCKGFDTVVISAPGALLGETRFLQALYCRTKWIALIDSDVYIKNNWWTVLSKQISDDVGIINSRCTPKCSFEEYKHFFDYCWIARPVPRINVSFSNTLTRRKLILNFKQLRLVHAGEDGLFFKYIKQLGLNRVTIQKDLAYHDNDIYLHHPFAYLRIGRSIKTPKIKIPLIFYRKIRKWFKYSKNNKSFNISLLFFVIKLCVFQTAGILGTFQGAIGDQI